MKLICKLEKFVTIFTGRLECSIIKGICILFKDVASLQMQIMYKKIKDPLHFIGIGGIGMSGIAEVLLHQGFPVTGSDLQESENTKKLQSLGAQVFIGHRRENLHHAKLIVVSSAIGKDNPELIEAQRLGLPIVQRAEMLAELMRLKFGIAVAGTHGKTTTTSMLASILYHAKKDPTIIVGGRVDFMGGNAKHGEGQFLIAEADESDGSFLHLSPVINIVTNIDNDHLDYYGQMEKLRLSFLEFVNKIPYYGRNVFCADDAEVRKLLPLVSKPYWTYGFEPQAQFHIQDYKAGPFGSSFKIFREKQFLCTLELNVPGKHNALNATAALAACLEIDLALEEVLEGLHRFSGVKRRFEVKGKTKEGVLIVDDYGHHPTEIKATLEAARNYWPGRILIAFQPHRYTRTQLCWFDFESAFQNVDHVFFLDIYAAGESEIPGIHSEGLASLVKKSSYVGSLENAEAQIRTKMKDGDLLITLGAGNITQLSKKFL